jgi:hypothetical protein
MHPNAYLPPEPPIRCPRNWPLLGTPVRRTENFHLQAAATRSFLSGEPGVSQARNLSRAWVDVRSLMQITEGLIDEVHVCGGFGVSCRFAENCLDRGLVQSPISISKLILQEAGISCSWN